MSRTDKTRPWQVRVWDRLDLGHAEVHDHRFGPCTLPTDWAEHVHSWASAQHTERCYVDWQWDGTQVCACSLCREPDWHRRTVRAERQRVRIELQQSVKSWRAGDEGAFDLV